MIHVLESNRRQEGDLRRAINDISGSVRFVSKKRTRVQR